MCLNSDDKPLERDFTYVDDIVKGIMAAMDYVPAECGEKFNLGFGQPLSVPQLISILEKELGVKGNIVSVTSSQSPPVCSTRPVQCVVIFLPEPDTDN